MTHFQPSCGDEECAVLDFERRAAGSGTLEKKEIAEDRDKGSDYNHHSGDESKLWPNRPRSNFLGCIIVKLGVRL